MLANLNPGKLKINLWRDLLTGMCLSLLVSCGFALRGTEQIARQFDSLELNLQQQNSPFNQTLKRSLNSAGYSITPGAYVLSVSDEQSSTRPITINIQARASQYSLRLAVEVSFHANNEAVYGPEILFIEKTYFEDIANIVGNSEEVEILKEEMRTELVNQILRGLVAINLE